MKKREIYLKVKGCENVCQASCYDRVLIRQCLNNTDFMTKCNTKYVLCELCFFHLEFIQVFFFSFFQSSCLADISEKQGHIDKVQQNKTMQSQSFYQNQPSLNYKEMKVCTLTLLYPAIGVLWLFPKSPWLIHFPAVSWSV